MSVWPPSVAISFPVEAVSKRVAESAHPTASCLLSVEKLSELTHPGNRIENSSAARDEPIETKIPKATMQWAQSFFMALPKASNVPTRADAGRAAEARLA